jgi:hypothetical protein
MTGNVYINDLSSENLSEILFHVNHKGIQRFTSKGFPVHLAIHSVDCLDLEDKRYVEPHYHDHPEINIILPFKEELIYEIQIEGETHIIKKPSAIWIPQKMLHAANLRKGKGFFICIILTDKYYAQS